MSQHLMLALVRYILYDQILLNVVRCVRYDRRRVANVFFFRLRIDHIKRRPFTFGVQIDL